MLTNAGLNDIIQYHVLADLDKDALRKTDVYIWTWIEDLRYVLVQLQLRRTVKESLLSSECEFEYTDQLYLLDKKIKDNVCLVDEKFWGTHAPTNGAPFPDRQLYYSHLELYEDGEFVAVKFRHNKLKNVTVQTCKADVSKIYKKKGENEGLISADGEWDLDDYLLRQKKAPLDKNSLEKRLNAHTVANYCGEGELDHFVEVHNWIEGKEYVLVYYCRSKFHKYPYRHYHYSAVICLIYRPFGIFDIVTSEDFDDGPYQKDYYKDFELEEKRTHVRVRYKVKNRTDKREYNFRWVKTNYQGKKKAKYDIETFEPDSLDDESESEK